MQTTCCEGVPTGLHVAIIMDGNGRWATARGRPRLDGHRAGIDALRRTVAAAPDLGIGTLTVYAFSADNWRRPPAEVAGLMGLVRGYLAGEVDRLVEAGIGLSAIGRRDRLPDRVTEALAEAETATAGGTTLHLRVALDYSGRETIVEAVRRTVARALAGSPVPGNAAPAHQGSDCAVGAPEALDRDALGALIRAGSPDVDLLIRTSGEQRLSDFLLWECAYAELHFTPVLWPDFGAADLADAMAAFHSRERRFGGVSGDAGEQERAA